MAAITGDKRYLKLAHQFSHHTVLQPLLRQEDKLTGMHANTQIPKVIGFKRIADLEGNRDWSEAARYFWETVVNHCSITIGGNSVREHFHPADDFSSMLTSEQALPFEKLYTHKTPKKRETSTEDESGQSSTPEGQLDLFSTDQENTQALPNE